MAINSARARTEVASRWRAFLRRRIRMRVSARRRPSSQIADQPVRPAGNVGVHQHLQGLQGHRVIAISRRSFPRMHRADPARHFVAAHPGQTNVEQHDFRMRAGRPRPTLQIFQRRSHDLFSRIPVLFSRTPASVSEPDDGRRRALRAASTYRHQGVPPTHAARRHWHDDRILSQEGVRWNVLGS